MNNSSSFRSTNTRLAHQIILSLGPNNLLFHPERNNCLDRKKNIVSLHFLFLSRELNNFIWTILPDLISSYFTLLSVSFDYFIVIATMLNGESNANFLFVK